MTYDPGSAPKPPRLARLLASLSSTPDDRALVLADLAERYERLVEGRGVRAARRWYWSQALRGLPHRLRPDAGIAWPLTRSGAWVDVRRSARSMRKRPLYALGVVGTLAIGLSSAAVVGSLAWHIWLAPMPFPDPDRVVRLFELEPPDENADPSTPPTRWRLSPPLLEQLRDHTWTTVRAVSGVARNIADWAQDGEVTRLTELTVSPEFFEIVGLAPLEGRVLSTDPDAAEVLLTEELWERAFGRDPAVVGGTTMLLNGRRHEIVGVVRLPVGYPGDADLVSRLSWSPDDLVVGMRGARYLDVIARVEPAYSLRDASAEMDRIVAAAGREFPIEEGWSGEAVVLGDELLRPYRGVLALLFLAGSVFLLLAVVNVTGLVAARAIEGRPERGIRLALGASEGRLLLGGVIESGLLGAVASVAALVFAYWLLGPIRALVPAEIPRVENVAVTAGVSAMIVSIALLGGGLVGVVAHLLSRGGPVNARRSTGSSERRVGRNLIVASQVALTTLLVTAGAGVLRTAMSLRAVDLGFEPDGVASTQVMLTGERYPSPETRLVLWRDLLSAMEARGLSAAVGTSPPMAGVTMRWMYRPDPTAEQAVAQYHVVSPEYFSIMGIAVMDGRPFTDDDDEGAAPVVIVNDVLGEDFPAGSAVGREIEVVGEQKTIVGVVEGARHFGPGEDVPREIYAPFTQDAWPHAQILVRGSPAAVGPVVASVVDGVDPALGVSPVQSYRRFVTDWFAGLRLQLIIVGVLGVVGLLLATLGLYALIAYRVSSRRRDIGVRMALGASGRLVFLGVLKQGLIVVSAGAVVGLASWYVAAPAARDWLGDVGRGDPWIPIVVMLFVGLTSAVAIAIPARRSVTVDPSVTLREE